jgi:hypothetical protein
MPHVVADLAAVYLEHFARSIDDREHDASVEALAARVRAIDPHLGQPCPDLFAGFEISIRQERPERSIREADREPLDRFFAPDPAALEVALSIRPIRRTESLLVVPNDSRHELPSFISADTGQRVVAGAAGATSPPARISTALRNGTRSAVSTHRITSPPF